MTTAIPNPNGRKFIQVFDADAGQVFNLECSVNSSGAVQIVVADQLSVSGLTTSTAGVTDSTNKRFVTDAELADLITLQPLAALEAVLAAVGARTGAETLLTSAAGVDLNTATPPTLYTVPTGKSCVITKIVCRLASTSLTTVSFSIGFTSTAFADVVADATHTGLTGNTLYALLTIIATGAKVGTTGQLLKLKNNIVQGGAATATFDIFGYLF